MADQECGRSSSPDDETSNPEMQCMGSKYPEKTRIVISKEPSDKEDDPKDDESDSRGMYTANRGFPPSRFAPRTSFSSPQPFSTNPFAAKPSMGRASMDEGSSSWQGLTPSKLGAFGAPPMSSPKIVLKPSAFSSASAGSSPAVVAPKTSFPLNPSRLGSPFAKAPNNSKDEEAKKDDSTEAAEKAKTPAVVKFVPLGSSFNSGSNADSNESSGGVAASASSFVFGQNLHERVESKLSATNTNSPPASTTESAQENGSKEEVNEPAPSTNGTTPSSEMLFSAVINKDNGEPSSDSDGTPAKSLSEAAREYEESRAVKRKFEEVEVKTGEEEETNVLQISCKLHTFDKAKGSWAERGRGQLRLNDKVENHVLQSRVIMRTHGSLRVVLNTKVWPEMVVDRANVRSVRFTAMDDDQIKVFLVTATPKEADNLYTALERRVTSQRFRASSNSQADADVPLPDNANSDVEQTRSCIEETGLPMEPSLKKGKPSLPDDDQPDSPLANSEET